MGRDLGARLGHNLSRNSRPQRDLNPRTRDENPVGILEHSTIVSASWTRLPTFGQSVCSLCFPEHSEPFRQVGAQSGAQRTPFGGTVIRHLSAIVTLTLCLASCGALEICPSSGPPWLDASDAPESATVTPDSSPQIEASIFASCPLAEPVGPEGPSLPYVHRGRDGVMRQCPAEHGQVCLEVETGAHWCCASECWTYLVDL
jgi:hypothetical protein